MYFTKKKCAAVEETAVEETLVTGYNDNGKAIAPLWSADNVDVQKATLTGSGTFHGTGIILSLISKGSFSANVIRRRKVTKDEILERMVVIKTYPRDKEKTIKDLALKGSGIATMSTKETKSNGLIDYLRVTSGNETYSTNLGSDACCYTRERNSRKTHYRVPAFYGLESGVVCIPPSTS